MGILKNKTLMGGAVVIAVAALGYYIYSSADSGTLLSSSDSGTSVVSQEILTTLSQLHAVQLNPSLFSDPLFTSLSDFGTTIPPQQAGRRNPFAPLGVGSGAPAQTSTTTQSQ